MKIICNYIIIVLLLIGCSPKVSQDLYWVDQYGELVPIMVTQKKDTTVYNFGTIIMNPDTTYRPDTINEIRHQSLNKIWIDKKIEIYLSYE
jgi:hypothetical protein